MTAEGKPLPTELRGEEAALRKEVALEDDNTAVQRNHVDDEYAHAGTPRMCGYDNLYACVLRCTRLRLVFIPLDIKSNGIIRQHSITPKQAPEQTQLTGDRWSQNIRIFVAHPYRRGRPKGAGHHLPRPLQPPGAVRQGGAPRVPQLPAHQPRRHGAGGAGGGVPVSAAKNVGFSHVGMLAVGACLRAGSAGGGLPVSDLD